MVQIFITLGKSIAIGRKHFSLTTCSLCLRIFIIVINSLFLFFRFHECLFHIIVWYPFTKVAWVFLAPRIYHLFLLSAFLIGGKKIILRILRVNETGVRIAMVGGEIGWWGLVAISLLRLALVHYYWINLLSNQNLFLKFFNYYNSEV